jgi:membrane-associated phospholipid phosphatase
MNRWLSPREQQEHARRRTMSLALVLALLLLAVLLDRPLFNLLYDPLTAEWYQQREWYQMLRVAGYYPTWVFISLALLLHAMRPWPIHWPRAERDPRVPRWLWWPSFVAYPSSWAGVLVALSAALAGLVCDVLKPLPGRLRPLHTGGFYRFHGLPDDISQGASFGLPSSHAAVAFGAAFMLWFLYPWAGVIALIAAAGCGFTRLVTGAHFVSDVFVSAVLAYAIAFALRPRRRPRAHGGSSGGVLSTS